MLHENDLYELARRKRHPDSLVDTWFVFNLKVSWFWNEAFGYRSF